MKVIMKIFLVIGLGAVVLPVTSCSLLHRNESVATQGQLCFEVDPAGAVVTVDGVEMGKSKEFTVEEGCLALEEGRHTVKLSAENHQPYEREYYVGTSTQHLKIKLAGG